jgi:hypothetical protein
MSVALFGSIRQRVVNGEWVSMGAWNLLWHRIDDAILASVHAVLSCFSISRNEGQVFALMVALGMCGFLLYGTIRNSILSRRREITVDTV